MLHMGLIRTGHVLTYQLPSLSQFLLNYYPTKQTILYRFIQISKYSSHCKPSEMPSNSKTFSFNDYDIIGFDLDNTLLRYNLQNMIPLEYDCIAKVLVTKHKYPKELLKPTESADMDFLQKGLFIDANRGNIIKMNKNGVVLRACHGKKLLSNDEISQDYGPDRRWDIAVQFVNDPISTWNGPLSVRIRGLYDYFDMPAALVFARAVDAIDEANGGRRLEKYNVYADILDALIEMFSRETFANKSSEYFEELKAHPEKYIIKSDHVKIAAQWLSELKKTKATYLLTGSNIDFSNLTASAIFGQKWYKLFDVIVCYARKPGFFLESRPYYHVEKFQESMKFSGKQLELGSIYSQGNWEQLKRLLINKFNIRNPRCLYVGDNLIQDIYTPSNYLRMDTVCLADEILPESNGELYEFSDIVNSNYWGSYFSIDGRDTIWTSIIEKYSKICFPTLDYFVKQPIDYVYRTKSKGFYPFVPKPLSK